MLSISYWTPSGKGPVGLPIRWDSRIVAIKGEAIQGEVSLSKGC